MFHLRFSLKHLRLLDPAVCVCVSLAAGIELGPGVRPPDLHRGGVVEDVVAQLLQLRLWIRCSKLSRVLHLLSDHNVDFLSAERQMHINSPTHGTSGAFHLQEGTIFYSKSVEELQKVISE